MIQLYRTVFVLMMLSVFTPDVSAQFTFEMMNGRMLKVFSYNDSAFIDIKYRYDKRSLKNDRILARNEDLYVALANKLEGSISSAALDSLVEKKKKPLKSPMIKEGFTPRAEVFAIHHPDGNRELLYEFNETIGNDFSVTEMQHYILGQRDALLNFDAKWPFWGGVAFGAAGGFAWQNSVFVVTTPAVWTLITALPTIRIREKYMTDPSIRTDEYRAGFARTARTRNMIQGLKGSLIGTVAGALIFAIVANNAPEIRY